METLDSRDGPDANHAPPSEGTPMSSLRTPTGGSVSTVFNVSLLIEGSPPDLIIITTDTVYFHVHTRIILRLSTNDFYGMLADTVSTITVAETAAVINVVLHVLYGRSCTEFKPTFEEVVAAVASLVKYGAALSTLAVEGLPLFAVLLAHAPLHAIDLYALAGQHKLEEVAVAVSAHLLAYDTSQLTDELAVEMGPVYLKRIMELHQKLLFTLKAIVLMPPSKHPATAYCDAAAQGRLTTAWAFAAAQLVWDVRPSISTDTLQTAFERAYTSTTCPDCRARLQYRIEEITRTWSGVKRTI
ncbi:hypothetical protein C8T65DRAFT_739835 [Cerioporus squamosus]|nr:hypothetical protein C8T65DRAFT_739835 [Cerioporus squamosus]